MSTSPPRRRLVVHLGGRKTGSTALQVGFARNRQALASHGVTYPSSTNDAVMREGGVDSGNGLALAQALGKGTRPTQIAQRAVNHVLDVLSSATSGTVLYSSELLVDADPARWREFVAAVEATGAEIMCVVYLRNVVEYAVSRFGQDVKRGLFTGTFSDYLARTDSSRDLSQAVIVDELISTVGRERLRLFHYDSIRGSLVAQFLTDVLGIEPGPDFDLVEERVNRSLTPWEIDVMRRANLTLKGKAEARVVSDAILVADPAVDSMVPARPVVSSHDLEQLARQLGAEVDTLNRVGLENGTLRLTADDAVVESASASDGGLTTREHGLVDVLTRVANHRPERPASTSPSFSHPGMCGVCGAKGDFVRGPHASVRESFPCPECRATLRWRDQAAVIVDEFGRGREVSVSRLASSGLLDDIDIYEPALGGPFVKILGRLPRYQNSYYWEGGRPGDVVDGVQFQDLGNLSFPDESFDLVITSDVFEHVLDPYGAFAEIARVLKVGGVHVFSIPLSYPLPRESVPRAELVGEELVHLLPPVYHRAGDGSDSLVITDWGSDLVDGLRLLGMHAQLQRVSSSIDPAYQNVTVLARRMS